jgi:hypothetical protein
MIAALVFSVGVLETVEQNGLGAHAVVKSRASTDSIPGAGCRTVRCLCRAGPIGEEAIIYALPGSAYVPPDVMVFHRA